MSEQLFEQVIRFGDEAAAQFCRQHKLAPVDPLRRAVFFILTGQWAEYATLDPERSLLDAALESSDHLVVQSLVQAIRQSGRAYLLQNSRRSAVGETVTNLLRPDNINWPLVHRLIDTKYYAELWQLALQSSAYWSSQIVRTLKAVGWQPDEPGNRLIFQKLTNLLAQCPPDLTRHLLSQADMPLKMVTGSQSSKVRFTANGYAFAKVNASQAPLDRIEIWNGRLSAIFDPLTAGRLTRAYAHIPPMWNYPLPATFSGKLNIHDIAFHPKMPRFVCVGGWHDAATKKDYAVYWVVDLSRLSGTPETDPAANVSAIGIRGYGNLEPLQVLSAEQTYCKNQPGRVALSGDGLMAIAGINWLYLYRGDGHMTMLNVLNFDKGDAVTDIAFSPDGQTLAVGFRGGYIHLLEIPSLRLLKKLVTSSPLIEQMQFSPDGQTIACGSQLHWLHLDDGTPVCRFDDDATPVTALAFNPGGQMLAAGYAGGRVRQWSAGGSYALESHSMNHPVVALSYSSDLQLFTCVDGAGNVHIRTSRLAYLYNLPVAFGTLDDIRWLHDTAQAKDLPQERALLQFIAAQLDLKWRYEVEIDFSPALRADGTDIELD